MNTTKPAWQSKTVWVSILITLIGAIEQFGQASIIPEEHQRISLLISGVLMLILRFMTNEPITTAKRPRNAKKS